MVADRASPQDLDLIDARVQAETQQAVGAGADEELSIVVRDASGQVVAGITGWTWGGCCELAQMWVDPSLRHNGLGAGLIAAAEEEALRRGCAQVVFFTHVVPASGLYERLGYETVGVVEGYPRGSAAKWFRKRLPGSPGGGAR